MLRVRVRRKKYKYDLEHATVAASVDKRTAAALRVIAQTRGCSVSKVIAELIYGYVAAMWTEYTNS